MEEAPELDAVLSEHLARLLLEHGVSASVHGGRVLVGDDPSRWARLSATRQPESSALRLHVDAAGPADSVLSDSLNGFGAEPAAAMIDALQHFCLNDFHVLLAGLWGLLEEDQVDHYVVSTENGRWDLYLGGWVSRMTDPSKSLPAPEAAFAKALQEAAPELLSERRPRAGRVFLAAVNGELTYEALLDMEPSEALEAVLRSVPLEPPASGYASQRLFFLALPQDGGMAHTRVGRCTAAKPAAPRAKPPMRDIWLALVACAVLLAAVYLLRR